MKYNTVLFTDADGKTHFSIFDRKYSEIEALKWFNRSFPDIVVMKVTFYISEVVSIPKTDTEISKSNVVEFKR